MIKLKTLVLAAVAMVIALPAVAEDDVKMRMGGDSGFNLQIAPGLPLNGGNAAPNIQIFQIPMGEKKPFEQVKPELEKAVSDYLKILDSDDARGKLEALRNAKAGLEARQGEFKAVAIKDDATFKAWTEKLFNDFDAYRILVRDAAQFELAASEPVNQAMFSADPKDLQANKDEVNSILKPTVDINQAWEEVLNEGKGFVGFVLTDSAPIYRGLVEKGAPQTKDTSNQALKIYFRLMLDSWAKE